MTKGKLYQDYTLPSEQSEAIWLVDRHALHAAFVYEKGQID